MKSPDINDILREMGTDAARKHLDENARVFTAEEFLKLDTNALTAEAIMNVSPTSLPGNSGVIDLAEKKASKARKAKNDNRPVIQIIGGSLSGNADEAEHALRAAEVPIFRQRGCLVRPARCTLRDSKGREVQIASIAEVTTPMLRDELCRHAMWEKYDRRAKDWVTTDPPKDVAETVLSRKGEGPNWSTLSAVSATPFIRRDGSIVSEHGFDEATGTFLLDPVALPPMPLRPDEADAKKALADIEFLLSEFPFVDEASKSVALSGALTPLARSAIDVAPAHAGRAPQPGSGKSYLWDIASAISNGVTCPVIAAGRDEEETEKRLVTRVLDGTPMFSLDNVNGTLGGDFLCQLVSQTIVAPRILGHSKGPQITNRFTIFATGNNISVTTDLVRRTLLCSMDAKQANPYERTFKGDPVADVLDNRGRYIAACLTILRAHALAGYAGTKDLTPFNGFNDWSRVVRGALVWLGKADPVLTVGIARSEDSEWADQIEFIHLVAVVFGYGINNAKSVSSMASETRLALQEADSEAEARAALKSFLQSRFCDHYGGINTRRAGKWLARFKDVVFEDVCLRSKPTKAGAEWYVESMR